MGSIFYTLVVVFSVGAKDDVDVLGVGFEEDDGLITGSALLDDCGGITPVYTVWVFRNNIGL